MSPNVPIDLHARRPSDVAPLRALWRALREAGTQPQLSAGPGLRGDPAGAELAPGPLPARLCVLVEDPHEPLADAPQAAERLAVLWTGAGAPQAELTALPGPLLRAELVLVPGRAHAAALQGQLLGRVEAVGRPELDGYGPALRTRLRAALGLEARDRVWLYAPSVRPDRPQPWPAGELEKLLRAPGVILALAAARWPEPWREQHRGLALGRPRMFVPDETETAPLLALADAVLAAPGALLSAAEALGLPCVRLGGEPDAPGEPAAVTDAAGARARLEGTETPPGHAADPDRLEPPGASAARAAQALLALLHPAGRAPAEPAGAAADWLEPIEAQLAFGDLDGARAALERRARSDPGAAVKRALARTERLAGALGRAEDHAREAAAAARLELAAVLCEQARIDVELGRFEEARARFEEAARTEPGAADAPVGLGSLALHAGDAAAAETQFRVALRLEKSARAWSGLGLALSALGRSRDALAALTSALELDPGCEAALYGLVQASLQTGELALAEERLHAYLEQHPGNLGFAYSLAAIALERGQLQRARETLERIELFDPDYTGLRELREKLGAAGG